MRRASAPLAVLPLHVCEACGTIYRACDDLGVCDRCQRQEALRLMRHNGTQPSEEFFASRRPRAPR